MTTLEDLLRDATAAGPAERSLDLDRLGDVRQTQIDLTQALPFRQATQLADLLLADDLEVSALEALENNLAAHEPPVSELVQLSVKLAISRRRVETVTRTGPLFVSVIFAVYKEHQRILPKEEHPAGEDFLCRKTEQMNWLFAGLGASDYEIVVVDDGCPEHSGRLAKEIATRNGYDKVRVLFLDDAIRQGLAVTQPLTSTDESRKGGSVEYGMWEATRSEKPGHVVIFTDADLSTHLGQVGLLVHGVKQGNLAAIGSRREETSVVIKGSSRNDRGKLFIYLWKRLLPQVNYITDTQCGFKAFDASIVREITTGTMEKQFAFDIELMLRTDLMRHGAITKVPIAWIDSEALSTTTDIQPYLSMLQKVAAMYRTYLPPEQGCEPFAVFIEGLTEDSWQELLTRIPAEITSRDPAEFDVYAGISAEDLRP